MMNQDTARSLQKVGEAFRLQGPFFSYEEICQGNVNVTYKVNYIRDDGTGMARIKPYLLPPFISMRFMNVCGVALQFHGIHMMYWKIVNCYFMDTIYEVNRQIEAAGFPAMKETV